MWSKDEEEDDEKRNDEEMEGEDGEKRNEEEEEAIHHLPESILESLAQIPNYTQRALERMLDYPDLSKLGYPPRADFGAN